MFTVIVQPRARKEILRLPKEQQERIGEMIDSLEEDAFLGKKMHGEWEGRYTIRVWPYRIIYRIDKDVLIVTVIGVAHRQGAYK